MNKIDRRDLAAGLLLAFFGLFVALYSTMHYEWGSSGRLGPAVFPTLLGWVLTALGVVIAGLACRGVVNVAAPNFRLRPFLAVVTAVAVFGMTVETIGLAPASILLAAIAALAERPYRPVRTAVLGVVLAALSWLIFVVGLDMQLSAFGSYG